MMRIDVTDQVTFGLNDDELLPLTKCVCGATFPLWECNIGVEDDYASPCDVCGRKLVFDVDIHVYEVREE